MTDSPGGKPRYVPDNETVVDIQEERIVAGASGWVDDAYIPNELDKEDMRHIAACLNACRGIPTELLEQIVRERHCILYDVKMYGYCSGETLVLDAETWAGNEDVIQRIEEERNQ